MKKNVLLLVGLVTLALSPMAVHADSTIDHKIDAQVVPALISEGFEIQGSVETGDLENGQSESFAITPPFGAEVIVVAIGGLDAGNLDMYVYSGETGERVAFSAFDDAMPVCRFVATGGTYRVSVMMGDTRLPAGVTLIYAIR